MINCFSIQDFKNANIFKTHAVIHEKAKIMINFKDIYNHCIDRTIFSQTPITKNIGILPKISQSLKYLKCGGSTFREYILQ